MSRISIVQVQVEALLFLEDILQNGHRIITCEIFEVAMRDGYRAIAERGDLDALADEGCYLLDHGADEAFADWLDPDRPFDAACRLFATVARQQGESIAAQAAGYAAFYASISSGTAITYDAALVEIQKFAPDQCSFQTVVVPPLSSRMQ
jgi:hypothetical protein